jgi:hypothetical protein
MNVLRSISRIPFFGRFRITAGNDSALWNLYADWGFFAGEMRLGLRLEMNGPIMETPEKPENTRLSAAGWIALAVLVAFFFVSLWYAVKVWSSMAGVQMSGWGWLFLVLGIVVTIALGAGLMALVFYSSRHDMDR